MMVLNCDYTLESPGNVSSPVPRQYPRPTKSGSLRVGPGISVVKPLHVIDSSLQPNFKLVLECTLGRGKLNSLETSEPEEGPTG